jgi:hypothetical protein
LFGIRPDRPSNLFLDTQGDGERCLEALDRIEKDGELIATESGGNIGGAQAILDAVRDFDEKGISGGVPEAIVDELEPI